MSLFITVSMGSTTAHANDAEAIHAEEVSNDASFTRVFVGVGGGTSNVDYDNSHNWQNLLLSASIAERTSHFGTNQRGNRLSVQGIRSAELTEGLTIAPRNDYEEILDRRKVGTTGEFRGIGELFVGSALPTSRCWVGATLGGDVNYRRASASRHPEQSADRSLDYIELSGAPTLFCNLGSAHLLGDQSILLRLASDLSLTSVQVGDAPTAHLGTVGGELGISVADIIDFYFGVDVELGEHSEVDSYSHVEAALAVDLDTNLGRRDRDLSLEWRTSITDIDFKEGFGPSDQTLGHYRLSVGVEF